MKWSNLPMAWRARRLANQVAATFAVTPPPNAKPGRWGAFKLRRQVDRLRGDHRTRVVGLRIDGYPHCVWLRAGSSDLEVVLQLMGDHELAFDLGPNPKWIVDLGANIGLSAVYFANRFPTARILAVEVERSNYELLVQNTRPYPQVTPIHRAVWHSAGWLRISNPEAAPWSFRVESTTADDPASIKAVSINELLSEFGMAQIDLVKMDIEGAERDVLSSHLYPWLDRTAVLAVELHERHRPGCMAALQAALAGMASEQSQQGEYTVIRLSSGIA